MTEGIRKLVEQSRAEGMMAGRAEGMMEGMKAGRAEIIKSMQTNGLPQELIEKIMKGLPS